jgi:hypothetical protein
LIAIADKPHVAGFVIGLRKIVAGHFVSSFRLFLRRAKAFSRNSERSTSPRIDPRP